VNTHPVANTDGDWSTTNRFYPVQRGQLALLVRLVRAQQQPTVLCGDFNVAADSPLMAELLADAAVRDVFAGGPAPTFREHYLPAGRVPQRIDFILVTGSVTVQATGRLFTTATPTLGGPMYVSDHVGLRAELIVSG
jgi:endonuclease/exonuclease/phosphatase family metal-dependent hydrolase